MGDQAGCDTYTENFSAYVDSALPAADQEHLAVHLSRCGPCRDEVESLRQVRALLRAGSPADASAPSALPERLRSIAGPGADTPLWSRTFDRAGTGDGFTALPSRRRSNLRRRVMTSSCLVTLLAGVLIIGWVAAPAHQPVVVDPSIGARSEFASALAQMPMANVAVGAVAAEPAAGDVRVDSGFGPAGIAPSGLSGVGTDCLRELERSQASAANVAVSGVQAVEHRTGSGWRSGTVEVANLPGFGTAVRIGGSDPDFAPAPDQPLVELASIGDYELACGNATQRVAERPATVVEARSGRGGLTRWWLDQETGYLLWTDRYAPTGLESRAGFVSLEIGQAIGVSGEAVQSGSAGQREAPAVAGMQLLSVSGDDSDLVRSVYGDGLTTLLISHQPGMLVPSEAMAWDDGHGVYQSTEGPVTVLTWQSGQRVWTVVTDGSAEVANEAAASLPHEAPSEPHALDRVRSGWGWILSQVGLS